MWNPFGEGVTDYIDTSTAIGDILNGPLAWQVQALCAQTDPEAFFQGKGGSIREAKAVCAQCEVREQRLEHALANDERFGIWDGLSERGRRHFKRRVP